jgi:hypothetical protein
MARRGCWARGLTARTPRPRSGAVRRDAARRASRTWCRSRSVSFMSWRCAPTGPCGPGATASPASLETGARSVRTAPTATCRSRCRACRASSRSRRVTTTVWQLLDQHPFQSQGRRQSGGDAADPLLQPHQHRPGHARPHRLRPPDSTATAAVPCGRRDQRPGRHISRDFHTRRGAPGGVRPDPPAREAKR